MRIWDVPAGYLSRQSLLGEHRELHGLYSILVNSKTGYSQHPETRRWVGCESALIRRHDLLAAEMRLRGYCDRTPLMRTPGERLRWPSVFVTLPVDQFALLASKYATIRSGRISLPRNAQELWAQHKYSVLARDPERYGDIGRELSRRRGRDAFAELAAEVTALLRRSPARGPLTTAIEHMWGYVSRHASSSRRAAASRSVRACFAATQELAVRVQQPYLLASTALSELAVYAGQTAE
jgi:hypothetical protein